MHGDVARQHVVTVDQIDDRSNFCAAVHIGIEPALGLDARKTAHRNVLADAPDQRRAHLFDRATVDRQLRQRLGIGRRVPADLLGQRCRKGEKILVARHEVGLAVDLDQGAKPRIVGNPHRDHAFGRDPCRRLACLVPELDAQDLLRAPEIAVRLGQRLLAFHHWRVGLLAQFLDHARSDCGHRSTPESLVLRRHAHRATGHGRHRPSPRTAVRPMTVTVLTGDGNRPYSSALSASSSISTNSSSSVTALTTSASAAARPSRIASAAPRAYRRIALPESSLPGIT